MHRTTTALLAVALLAGTAACSSGAQSNKPAATPKVIVTTASPSYDAYDCRALLERNFEDDTVHDASSEPKCASLTHDEYVDVVKKVVTSHKDDFLADAAQQYVWDQAWEGTAKDQQKLVCERLLTDGPKTVGREMAASSGGNADERVKMSRYLLKEKC